MAPMDPSPAASLDANREAAVVELRGLSKRYGKHLALRQIDLELKNNEIVGVVGPDGAGKTTLIRTLAGLLEIEARQAVVLGYDLLADVTDLKREIGYVPQSFSLQRDMSILENLRFTGRLHRIPTPEFESRAGELLQRTGLAPFSARVAGALSGGMKQKLAIANALLPRPRLLLLDEPTAGVDVSARDEIWSLLTVAREQALVVLSTSYLEEAEACDRLIYLDEGKVIASDTPEALKRAVPVELYRAWCGNPRRLVQASRVLPYVDTARSIGAYARFELQRSRSPGRQQLRRDLEQLSPDPIFLLEQLPIDMEATLLHLARGSIREART